MVIFYSYVSHYQRVSVSFILFPCPSLSPFENSPQDSSTPSRPLPGTAETDGCAKRLWSPKVKVMPHETLRAARIILLRGPLVLFKTRVTELLQLHANLRGRPVHGSTIAVRLPRPYQFHHLFRHGEVPHPLGSKWLLCRRSHHGPRHQEEPNHPQGCSGK